MRERLQRFMIGRYGLDALGKAIIGAAFVCLILNVIFPKLQLSYLALFLLVLCYIRMFSRNIQKRYQENQRFLQKTAGITGWFKKQKGYSEIKKQNYRIYACPSCKQKVKVPKGKGRISIHCPKCGTYFIKKS